MYAYRHDPETGGLLLHPTPLEFSKEPRPAYAGELDILGFNEFWQYEPQLEQPYMWAEANFYWYRGKRVARIKGGDLYVKPTVEPELDSTGSPVLPMGETLLPVDIARMTEKNRALLEAVDKITKKRIYYYFSRYRRKFDLFRLSFSGGKDSTVLLDILKDAIPMEKLVVLFCDTRMEFPDTYEFIKLIAAYCKEIGIAFHTASSSRDAIENWKEFGPPSRILRWCCSVHKSAPMTLKMREISGRSNFSELVFVGVRSYESEARAGYKYFEKSKKVKGQTTCNPLLDWTSAEIWLYTYYKNLPINRAYKFGNQRVGCLLCPMSLKTDYIKNTLYPKEMAKFVDIVKQTFSAEDIANGYWCARTTGEPLYDNERKIYEDVENNLYSITVYNPKNNINEWIKTVLPLNPNMRLLTDPSKITLSVDYSYYTTHRSETAAIKNVLYKTAYCIGCGVCSANCPSNSLNFTNKIAISNCTHCQACNKLDYGCLVYASRRFPPIKEIGMAKDVIDRYSTHPPRTEWLERLFKGDVKVINKKESDLGKEQISRFRAFLNDMDMLGEKRDSPFLETIIKLGWNRPIAASLILVNMGNSPQFKWYIKNLSLGNVYSRQQCIQMIYDQGYNDRVAKNVVGAFKHFSDLIFCRILNWGKYTLKGKNLATLYRTKPTPPDPRVYLYGLYKFAEALNGYHEIPLGRLLDFAKESPAISPSEIFALSREETAQYLRGLAQNFPDFVPNFTTTHGLEILYLNPEKTSADVLELFA